MQVNKIVIGISTSIIPCFIVNIFNVLIFCVFIASRPFNTSTSKILKVKVFKGGKFHSLGQL
jgi:hypothetical protein